MWYKSNSNKCNNCEEIDYPEHSFYTCTDVNTLWTSIPCWWKSVLDTSIKIDVIRILFGIADSEDDYIINILNLCMASGIFVLKILWNCSYVIISKTQRTNSALKRLDVN